MVLPTDLELLPSWWDEDYYLENNSDVATAVEFGLLKSGLDHFIYYGAKEGRDPSPGFNTQYYLDQYPDVAEAIRNGAIDSAFEHWLLYGQQENRQATPEGIIIPQQKFSLRSQEATDPSIPLTSDNSFISKSNDNSLDESFTSAPAKSLNAESSPVKPTEVQDNGLTPTSDPSLVKPNFKQGLLITLRADETNAFTSVLPPVSSASEPKTQSATINVTYNGFTPQAQTAFQYAVDIWESLIDSPVPIQVVANWTSLSSGILGQAGANYNTANFSGAPVQNTWYSAALANKLAGTDLQTSEADITASFNSNYSNWYLGTDGNTPAGQYDFVSVVLHELGHGLGFAGSMRVEGGQGDWGGGAPYPVIFDRFAVNGSNQSLIDTALFPNPSAALANQLQSNNIFFNGSNAVGANSGIKPKLYAPATWQPGSSYSHLDEATYGAGNINSLMTPAIGAAEAIHNPGPIALGILKDMGWTTTSTTGPANDNFVNRITLGSPSAIGSNANATKESGEPNHGGNVGGKSVWWSWTAPADGNFTLSTAGSNFDTLLGLYTGSNVAGLSQIAGNDDANGTLQSQVSFNAVAGTSYQIGVDGYNGVSGNIALKLAPTNDNFANQFTLSGSSTSATGSNVFASKETSEPNHGGFTGGKSVWWSWTAPASGDVTLSTAGSNFDTLLGVYTGSDVTGLNLIAGNDDSNSTVQSLVTFNAIAGTDYKIAVDGYGGSEGAIALNLQQALPTTGEIRGLKWNDLDGDGTRDANEPGLSGWTIYLDRNQNGQLDNSETSNTTDASGNYAFTGLAAGTYTVAEVMQDGWEQTYPGTSGDSSTEPIAITTTDSPVPISTYGEIVKSSKDEEIKPLTNVSGPLVNLDDFRADPRFAGINGNGFSTVILDTGIDLNHPYFGSDNNSDGVADRIVYQYDFANRDADASDYNGHGSNVSSIVASSDSVHTGMAPGANIIHLKVFTDSGSGNFGYVEQALQWVLANADTYNIASVNMSLGDSQNWNTGQTRYGISDEIAALAANNVMVVSAAGNSFYGFGSAQGVSYPAADPNSLAVGAVYDSNAGSFNYGSGAQAYTTGADRITPFSQRHSTLTSIFAPGAPITGAGPTGGTVTMHGTSQAAPHIAGIAALAQQLAVQTLGRRLSLDEFRNLLSSTGVTINDGDDENDNVANTGLDFKRVDVKALGEGILAMAGGGGSLGTHTVNLSPGQVVTGKDFGNKQISPPNVVTNTNDSGSGSLRAAIEWANSNPGVDTITFNIAGSGVKTITPLSALPTITDAVIIDGTSQPGFSGTPIIELNGSSAGANANGLNISAGNSTVKGLIINRFSGDGIELTGGSGNVIAGHYIGTDATGTVDLGNSGFGINVYSSSNNTIGGTVAGTRNLISGNGKTGVYINSGTTGNQVVGNYIGTDTNGTADLGNAWSGVSVFGANNTIGGTVAGVRNLISGNDSQGVSVFGSSATGNQILGNYIGTDITGTVDLGNTFNGVSIVANNNTIGGTAAETRNIISGNNSSGIEIVGSTNQLLGNYIGTQIDGINQLGNASHGVYLWDGANNNTIGGTSLGSGNTIAFNGGNGVSGSNFEYAGTGNRILSNAIFSNTGLGIDLDNNGVTPNDPGDSDTGPNSRQNFPILTAATPNSSNTNITGTLNSTANTTFRVEFFANTAADPSNYGEGQTFLGFTNITTDASGNANFSTSLPTAVPLGQFISATATDSNNNTSEFSQVVTVSSSSSPFIDSQNPNWKVQATEDFNGDDKDDIFWRDESTGNNQLWLMNGQTVTSTPNVNSLTANWKVQGSSDFNGDNKADILWRDLATGQNLLWLMDGTTVASSTSINPSATNWKVQATDDFNGDNKADILWRDLATGQNALWLMNGTTRIGSGNINGAGTNWKVQATDDFNGDNKADILWRDTVTGQNAIWLMNGMTVASGRNITGAEIAWEVEDTDDFNGDNKADILWRKTPTGENAVWLVDGTTVTSRQNISSVASRWQVQGTSDFNGDSKADILWRDPATGQNAMWLMDGLNNSTGSLLA